MDNVSEYITPFGVDIDLVEGAMHQPDNHIIRRASDMVGYYVDEQALRRLIKEESDPVHYEVFEMNVPLEAGHLMFCVSKLNPGRVGDECFMTKGHFHQEAGTAEVYLCIRGEGYMLMKTPDEARCVAEPMTKGRLVYVPPFWAHRSINTGNEPLVSVCVYPGEAGHNYGDIAERGFPKRVFLRNGKEVIA